MTKYKKKPVEIEAIQYTGDNVQEIIDFTNGKAIQLPFAFFISTLEGQMNISVNDYIIKGVKGEFYPCKPDIFEQTYEKVEE